ncbi:uncharacterized protein LOC134751497 [Cydia strobilella]|uniref:uncharacterized protein LOC134751497 n=1 Tax=Cydia strobilella TaxID=1100964 RepID=UPI0030067AAD
MDSKNEIFEELASKMNSQLSVETGNDDHDESYSRSENESDGEWETMSESEWSISDSDWSIAGDTESASDTEDEFSLSSVTPSLKDWSDEIRSAKVCPFKLKPGLKESCGKSPVDFFKLMFTRSLFEFLVNNINNYAMKIIYPNQQGRRFKEVTVNEFYVFFGLLLNIGTINTNIIDDFLKTPPIVEDSEEFMSDVRFGIILKCLNFEHELPGKNDKMCEISHMIDYFNIMMRKLVNPEKVLCIEESITVPCYEHVYLLTDEFGLAHKLVVYQYDQKPGPNVAKTLLEDKLDVGHSVYLSDVYNSLELTKFLIDRKTYVTGPIQRKRFGVLKEFKEKQLNKGEKIVKYNADGICVTKWKERREIIMISSEHSGEWKQYIDAYNQKNKKPACVLEYNKYRDSIEKHDEMMGQYYFVCGKKTRTTYKYKRLGVHILQMLMLNAYILYNKYGGKSMSLIDFRTVVVKHLLSYGKRVRV